MMFVTKGEESIFNIILGRENVVLKKETGIIRKGRARRIKV